MHQNTLQSHKRTGGLTVGALKWARGFSAVDVTGARRGTGGVPRFGGGHRQHNRGPNQRQPISR